MIPRPPGSPLFPYPPLFRAGADVNAQGGEYGNTLQAASFGGHDQVVQRLLEAGADVNPQGRDSQITSPAASLEGNNNSVLQRLHEAADHTTAHSRHDKAQAL